MCLFKAVRDWIKPKSRHIPHPFSDTAIKLRYRICQKIAAEGNSQDQMPSVSCMPFFAVDAAGHILFPEIKVQNLLKRAAPELLSLQQTFCSSKTEFDHDCQPFINKAAAMMGFLPASQARHDIGPGGLFIHSIRVAVTALKNYYLCLKPGTLSQQLKSSV